MLQHFVIILNCARIQHFQFIFFYIVFYHVPREEERSKLSTSQNGTFLVRKSHYSVAPYTLVFSYNGQLKGFRIIYSHGKYRISKISPDFNTVQELIEYYQTFPLPTLDIKLEYPVSRYEKVFTY